MTQRSGCPGPPRSRTSSRPRNRYNSWPFPSVFVYCQGQCSAVAIRSAPGFSCCLLTPLIGPYILNISCNDAGASLVGALEVACLPAERRPPGLRRSQRSRSCVRPRSCRSRTSSRPRRRSAMRRSWPSTACASARSLRTWCGACAGTPASGSRCGCHAVSCLCLGSLWRRC